MKTLMGLLCLVLAPNAFASEDFVLSASVSATQCRIVNGLETCTSTFEPQQRNIVVGLSECSSGSAGWEMCTGKWEGTRHLGGLKLKVRIQVQKTSFGGFSASYQLTASIQGEGGAWRHLRVTTGAGSALTDSLNIDGAEFKAGDATVTPALSVGPAN